MQVREVTARLRPITASWESLEPGTPSILSSIALPGKQEAEDEEKDGNSQGTEEGKDELGREERNATQTGIYYISISWMFRFWAYTLLKVQCTQITTIHIFLSSSLVVSLHADSYCFICPGSEISVPETPASAPEKWGIAFSLWKITSQNFQKPTPVRQQLATGAMRQRGGLLEPGRSLLEGDWVGPVSGRWRLWLSSCVASPCLAARGAARRAKSKVIPWCSTSR